MFVRDGYLSPDGWGDLWLFPTSKDSLHGMHFECRGELHQAPTSTLASMSCFPKMGITIEKVHQIGESFL